VKGGEIRVLVADDSPTMVTAIIGLLSEDPRVRVVGQANDGLRAVELAKTLRPDVITMDVVMPGVDGLRAIETIMAEAPSRILVVASVEEQRQMDLSFRAIAAGAMELLAKPALSPRGDLKAWGGKLRGPRCRW
jgi:two-component system, chemotaxis family, protein-glutamate methylesterase/glutaminase